MELGIGSASEDGKPKGTLQMFWNHATVRWEAENRWAEKVPFFPLCRNALELSTLYYLVHKVSVPRCEVRNTEGKDSLGV